jgi:transposase
MNALKIILRIIFLYFKSCICYSWRHLITRLSTKFTMENFSDKDSLVQENKRQDGFAVSQNNHERIAELERLLEKALVKIKWYEEQLKRLRHRQFGKSSEKTAAIQADLIFNIDDGLPAPAEEAATTEEEKETITYTRRKKTGRNIDTSKLPRRQEVHDLSDEEKICGDCGNALHKVRDEVCEQLEIIPRQIYVVEHVRPQYACRHCVTMTAAEKCPSPIPKSMAGASLIADVVVSKYEHHLPLYRQSKIWQGLGLAIPDNTLGHWVMQSAEGLRVLDEALQNEILRARYLQVDETPVKVLEPEKQAYMWVFLSPLKEHSLIRFRFDLTRRGSIVEEELKTYRGLLQNDGYSGYNGVREQSGIIALGCAAHARRKFAEVAKLAAKKSGGKSHEALAYFAKLYAIEDRARRNQMEATQRKLLRQAQAVPILEAFQKWLIQSKNQVPPQSAISKAIEYTLKHWSYLRRYVDYGEAEIDNNWVENQIRPFALGKKNWLFTSHEESAQIAALFYSLIQSAKLNALNPRVYLHYLLTQIHALRKKVVHPFDLLPHRIHPDVLTQFAEEEFKKAQSIFSPS